MGPRPLVNVVKLGLIKYDKAFKIQTDTVKKVTETNGLNVLYLLEHHPVYTVGVRSELYSTEAETKLKSLNADFFRANRGGLITFHGPGQLVAYPIINLKSFNLTLKTYVRCLEKTAILTAKKFGIDANTTENVGVWVGDNKLAAIGVRKRQSVTLHGLAMNCNVDLKWFEHIVPCGLEGKGVTSLSKELKKDISVDEAFQPFLESFSEVLSCDLSMS